MTYFNRSHPLQGFTNTNPAGAAVIPLNGTTFTGSATASVSFIATAGVSSTRTGSPTASVIFVATNTFTQLFTSSVASAPLESVIGGNLLGVGQSIHRSSAGSW